jgi:hypothetical protein
VVVRAWLLLALLLGGISLAQSALELEVLRRTNQVRTEHGLRPLRWDPLAYKAALGHAKDMLKHNFFAHQNQGGLGALERMQAAGLMELITGENLASFEGFPSAEIPGRSLSGWMNSPGHRANLLRPEFTHLGVALVRQGRRVVVVQNFVGRPFELRVGLTPAQADRTVLVLSGTGPGTVGVFVGSNLYARVNPPIAARLELPPRTEVSFAVFDGKTWRATRNGERGLRLETTLEESLAPGRRVVLNLPAGSFSLAVGKEPRFWQKVAGPVRLEFTLPETLEALWVGSQQGDRFNYTHRIPLTARLGE